MSSPLEGVSATILAGGLGTRLRSVVSDRPKVLAPVAGKPCLAHLLDQLARAGIRETTLLLGHAADQVQAAFGTEFDGMKLAYSVEAEPLGTGGALRLALPHLQHKTVLLLNGDSYCDVDLDALLAFHRAHSGFATLTLAEVSDGSRYGRVHLNEHRRIERFEEKGGASGPGWINAGVYLFARVALSEIEPGRAVSLEREVLPNWVSRGEVFGFPARGRFIDIGTPESYAEAEAFFGVQSRRCEREKGALQVV